MRDRPSTLVTFNFFKQFSGCRQPFPIFIRPRYPQDDFAFSSFDLGSEKSCARPQPIRPPSRLPFNERPRKLLEVCAELRSAITLDHVSSKRLANGFPQHDPCCGTNQQDELIGPMPDIIDQQTPITKLPQPLKRRISVQGGNRIPSTEIEDDLSIQFISDRLNLTECRMEIFPRINANAIWEDDPNSEICHYAPLANFTDHAYCGGLYFFATQT